MRSVQLSSLSTKPTTPSTILLYHIQHACYRSSPPPFSSFIPRFLLEREEALSLGPVFPEDLSHAFGSGIIMPSQVAPQGAREEEDPDNHPPPPPLVNKKNSTIQCEPNVLHTITG
jgi:hypothetical protein